MAKWRRYSGWHSGDWPGWDHSGHVSNTPAFVFRWTYFSGWVWEKTWKWKRKWIPNVLSSLIFFVGFGIFYASLVLPEMHFRLNSSNSLPQTLFLAIRSTPPFAKGNIVSIDHPILGLPVGKIIAGMPGDRISISDNTLFVNEMEIGKIQAISKSGKTYSPINEGIIEEGSYFVYTPHPDSFDSRYAEFGLIREEWIAEVLWPIF